MSRIIKNSKWFLLISHSWWQDRPRRLVPSSTCSWSYWILWEWDEREMRERWCLPDWPALRPVLESPDKTYRIPPLHWADGQSAPGRSQQYTHSPQTSCPDKQKEHFIYRSEKGHLGGKVKLGQNDCLSFVIVIVIVNVIYFDWKLNFWILKLIMERNELILMQEDETKLCSENDSGHADHHGHVLLLPADPLLPGSTSGLISVVIHTTIMQLYFRSEKRDSLLDLCRHFSRRHSSQPRCSQPTSSGCKWLSRPRRSGEGGEDRQPGVH